MAKETLKIQVSHFDGEAVKGLIKAINAELRKESPASDMQARLDEVDAMIRSGCAFSVTYSDGVLTVGPSPRFLALIAEIREGWSNL